MCRTLDCFRADHSCVYDSELNHVKTFTVLTPLTSLSVAELPDVVIIALFTVFWTEYWCWLRALSIDTNTYAVDSRLSWLKGDDETVMKIGFDFRIKFYLVPRILSKCLGRGM